VAGLKKWSEAVATGPGSKHKQLTREVERPQPIGKQLYKAVEQDFLPMDSRLTERAHKIPVQWQALLTEIVGLRASTRRRWLF
jgi:hypothetical protein